MTDDEIAALLRSDASVVVIEAPAGCGKTYQAASFASHEISRLKSGKVLVLTHTHAACSVIAERTYEDRSSIDIRTLDSLINQIAAAYRLSLGLPEDVAGWARQNSYEALAEKVANLLRINSMICRHIAQSFPVIICDEHQDSNEDQDAIVRSINAQGAKLRIFGDPMQIIPGGRNQRAIVEAANQRWENLKTIGEFGELETTHRWSRTNPQLGLWILNARRELKDGNPIVIDRTRPNGVFVRFAENGDRIPGRYRLAPENWNQLNTTVDEDRGMLLVGSSNPTVNSLRASFRRRFPIWEGHTRNFLEGFITSYCEADNDLSDQARAFILFLKGVIVGFTDNRFGNRFLQEIQTPSQNSPRGQIPPQMKIMAEFVLDEPTYVGFSKAAGHLRDLINQRHNGFTDLQIDYPRELGDLIKLGKHADIVSGFAEISQRRSRSHPKPPRKALSTIHKSKGLEAEAVVIFGCDGRHFAQTDARRNLLYVAMSRATHNITFVVSRNDPTPLISIGNLI
jgi:hypothetical protein